MAENQMDIAKRRRERIARMRAALGTRERANPPQEGTRASRNWNRQFPGGDDPAMRMLSRGIEQQASQMNLDDEPVGPPTPGEVTGEVGVFKGANADDHVKLVSEGKLSIDDVVQGTLGQAQQVHGSENVKLVTDPREALNRGVYILDEQGKPHYDKETSQALFRVINEHSRVQKEKAIANPALLSGTQRAMFEALGGDPKREEAFLRDQFPNAKFSYDQKEGGWIAETPEVGPQFVNKPGLDVKDIGAGAVMAARELPGAIAQTAATVRGASPGMIVAAGAGGDAVSAMAENAVRPFLPGQEKISESGRGAELAKDVGGRVLGGIVAEGFGAGLRYGARKLGPFLPVIGAEVSAGNLARMAAKERGEQTLGTLADQTVQEFATKSQKIENRFNQILQQAGSDKRLNFDAAQATGAPSLLAAKDALRTLPETAQKVLQQDAKQIDAISEGTGAIIKKITNNQDVGLAKSFKLAKSAVRDEWKALLDSRRRTANALFADVAKKSANAKTVIADPAIGALRDLAEIEDFSRFSGTLKGRLQKLLSKVEVGDDGVSRASVTTMHGLRQLFSDVVGRRDTLLKTLEGKNAKERYLAGQILSAIDEGFEQTVAEGGLGADGTKALVNAMAMYKAQSEVIESTINETARSLLKTGKGARPKNMLNDVMAMGEDELDELFGFLDEYSPQSAANIRGHILRDIASKADAGFGGNTFGADLPGVQMQPGRFLRELNKPERRAMMHKVFGEEATEDIKSAMEALGRIVNDPKIHNSLTAPRIQFAGQALKLDKAGLTDRLSTLLINAVRKGHFNAEAVEKSLLDPVMRRGLIDTAAAIRAPGSVKGHVAKSAANYLARLAQDAARSEGRTEDARDEQGLETSIRASRGEFTPDEPPAPAMTQQNRNERRAAARGGRY